MIVLLSRIHWLVVYLVKCVWTPMGQFPTCQKDFILYFQNLQESACIISVSRNLWPPIVAPRKVRRRLPRSKKDWKYVWAPLEGEKIGTKSSGSEKSGKKWPSGMDGVGRAKSAGTKFVLVVYTVNSRKIETFRNNENVPRVNLHGCNWNKNKYFSEEK